MVLELPTLASDTEAQEEEEDDGGFAFDVEDGGIVDNVSRIEPSRPESEEDVRIMKVGEESAGRSWRATKLKHAYEEMDGRAIQEGMFEKVLTEDAESHTSFPELGLSRSLLRAVAALGFITPTAVQARVIPLALAGRDVCASAATGSGKTAAFALPLLERIMLAHETSTIKAIVLQPTRELANQCESMVRDLSKFAPSIRCCLASGGTKDVDKQRAALVRRPDIVVATPGRLLDHATNSVGVDFSMIKVLVLDEADRLLELGFQEQVEEIVRLTPGSRQSMLFSATFGPRLESLIALSLRRPVRVKITTDAAAGGVARRLTQDFVRLRSDDERDAVLVALLSRTFKAKKTAIFFDTKADCARVATLIEVVVAQPVLRLRGDLKQAERSANFEAFRNGKAAILACTDVAARGLDVTDLRCVINYEMPRAVATYVHRVGRTARAGRSGHSVTLVGAERRAVLKDYLRARQAQIDAAERSEHDDVVRARTVPANIVAEMREAILGKADEIASAQAEERASKVQELALIESERAVNLIEHADDIKSRPRREWFQSTKAKEETQRRAKQIAEDEEARAAHVRRDDAITAKHKLGVSRGVKALPADGHRLSRKKRRRMQQVADAGTDVGMKVSKKIKAKEDLPLASIPSHKTSFHDHDDDRAVGASKEKRGQTTRTFVDFDAGRVGKRVKKSQREFSGGFKSKARYKRRA